MKTPRTFEERIARFYKGESVNFPEREADLILDSRPLRDFVNVETCGAVGWLRLTLSAEGVKLGFTERRKVAMDTDAPNGWTCGHCGEVNPASAGVCWNCNLEQGTCNGTDCNWAKQE